MLDALADAGLRVKDLPALINRDIDYSEQIPVLIEWLPRVQYPRLWTPTRSSAEPTAT